MGTPVVFTQEQLDQMDSKPFDVYDKDIRKNMGIHKDRMARIAEMEAARDAALKKWKRNDPATIQPDQ